MSNFVVIRPVPAKKYCILGSLKKAPVSSFIERGAVVDNWSNDAQYKMDPNFPKQLQLPDVVDNLERALVISRKLKELIEGFKPVNLQYLPVKIFDHKGKLASSDYFIAHCSHLQDVIDKKASTLEWNPIDPERIAICMKLVADESKIQAGALIFRMKHFPTPTVVSRELSKAISNGGFTGVGFSEVGDLH